MVDYGTICSYLLCVDWNTIIACHGCNIQSLYDCFLKILLETIELFVPKFPKKKTSRNKPLHINIIMPLLKENHNLHQLAMINPLLQPNYKIPAKSMKMQKQRAESIEL